MKPKLLSGTRDFSSEMVNKRNHIFSILKDVFTKYGFNPIETPAIEALSTLTGKYGDEGDQLLFKVLNSGDYWDNNNPLFPFSDIKSKDTIKVLFHNVFQKFIEINKEKTFNINHTHNTHTPIISISTALEETLKEHPKLDKKIDLEVDILKKYFQDFKQKNQEEILKKVSIGNNIIKIANTKFSSSFLNLVNKIKAQSLSSKKLTSQISKRALRYDLTVPFARYVVLNRNNISFPFKRYQIQPVWRADKPQKGRYREFYQCDVDVIGSDSLLYEAELCQIYDEVFAKLNLGVVIRLNNRKILEGIAEYAGHLDQFSKIVVILDKLDKIGWDKVENELRNIGVMASSFDRIKEAVTCPNLDKLEQLLASTSPNAWSGVKELKTVLEFLEGYSFTNTLKIDFTLARGLSYYTGCIYEVEVDKSIDSQKDIKMGSIGGGGRYADLTGIFGLKNMSGVGVSFGAARIYDVMEELNLFEEVEFNTSKVLFLAMDDAALKYGFKALQQVRAAGISSNIYPKAWNFQKLMKYADKVKVPYVVIIGNQEMESGQLGFKNMQTGEHQALNIEQIIQALS